MTGTTPVGFSHECTEIYFVTVPGNKSWRTHSLLLEQSDNLEDTKSSKPVCEIYVRTYNHIIEIVWSLLLLKFILKKTEKNQCRSSYLEIHQGSIHAFYFTAYSEYFIFI